MQDNPQVKHVCWKKKLLLASCLYNTKHVTFDVLFSLQINVTVFIFDDFSTLCLLDMPTQCQYEVDIIILSDLIWIQLALLSTLLHMVCHFTGIVKHWNKVQHSGCHVLSFIYTHDNLVTHALVWLSTVQLSASNMNSRRPHTFKHKIRLAYG